ncbi:hypothetical protein [Zoogloea sp.]|uniref:hypothetical protein n=1 Tax=Zoogloea sp. TaxID=49181 RepID=UPI0035B4B087
MAEDAPQKSVGTTTDRDALIALTLNAFNERLKQLENPEEKSRSEKIQKNASFIALIIGIALSLVSLFDVFLIKPREALFRDIDEFNKAVNSVANLRQSMIQVQFQSNNPQMILAMNSMVTPQVLAHIQYATELLPRLGDYAGIPQLIVLISEAMNIYDWKSAEILVDRAVAAKGAVPSLQAEARRYKARLMFFTGRVQEGRKAYEDALNVIRNESAFGINGSRAYIVSDWIVAEFSLGDCNIANERVRQFMEFVQNPQVTSPARSGLISTLKSQLGQLQEGEKRCPFPSSLL